jgi:hypothetical protein
MKLSYVSFFIILSVVFGSQASAQCPPGCKSQLDRLEKDLATLREATKDAPITAQWPRADEPKLVGNTGQKDFKKELGDRRRLGWAIISVVRAGGPINLKDGGTVIVHHDQPSTVRLEKPNCEITFTYSQTTLSYRSTCGGEHGYNVAFIPFSAGGP